MRSGSTRVPSPSPARRTAALDARGNYEGQCALIVDVNLRVPHAERFQNLFGLPADRLAVVGLYPGLEFNCDAAAFVGFNAHMQIRADIRARVAGFAGASFGCAVITSPFLFVADTS